MKKGYFRLKTSRGVEFDIRKGTLCYIYQKRDEVSSDRLFRFRATANTPTDNSESIVDGIKINDYVLMKSFNRVCHIIQFKYINKRRKKDAEFICDVVSCDHKDFNNIGALCTFYKYDFSSENLKLELSRSSPLVVPLTDYLITLPQPSITENDYLIYDSCISLSILNTIKNNFDE